MTEGLEVRLFGEPFGTLSRQVPGGALAFAAGQDAVEHYGIGSTVLSAALPLQWPSRRQQVATNFFGALLPEGRGRSNLARQAGVDSTDAYGMLAHAGRDLPGAVSVVDTRADQPEPAYVPAGEAEIQDLLARTADYALGSVGGGGSLPGFQPKATMAILDGQWHTTTGGATSTHILKPVPSGGEWGAHWEAYCLSIARKVGLLDFDADVVAFGARTALVVERYDRTHVPPIQRLHQEDAAQALDRPWEGDAKYEAVDPRASLANIAGLLPAVRRLSTARGDRHRLLAYTTFNVAIGNTDAHAKNFSILHTPEGAPTLAPMYDVTALALAPDGQQNVAMRIDGASYQPSITTGHLAREGARWGIPEAVAKDVVQETLELIAAAAEDTDPGEAGDRLRRYIVLQTRNLLGGGPAAVSPEPAYLATF